MIWRDNDTSGNPAIVKLKSKYSLGQGSSNWGSRDWEKIAKGNSKLKWRPFFFFRGHLDFGRKTGKSEMKSKWRPFFFFFREHLDFWGKIAESEIDSRWRSFLRGREKICLWKMGLDEKSLKKTALGHYLSS